ncbi:hypothetical protein QR680_017923 [Steinernema hermaphroditum]|uniref:Uncharacterized protein n=1 Tax=Steinernema hermaphroditum TaxID=289476 RepID=A0AA39HGB0_9BILA|nr:hypothetical protein QR680_017923 [Steinernema hermaphroditum]
MSNNLLDSYNPLYDANLRHYFTSPHMQRHLRSIGLLDSNGVPVANNGNVDSEVYSRHYVMMDMLLRNRESQLMQLVDLQKKLDAAEKVQSYRRVRSGTGSPDAGRRFHISRSLSRPRGRIEKSARIRRHSNHYEDGDVIKRVELEYDNEIPPIRNIYDRLSQRAMKYRYLHKLDDKTLTSYKESLQNQLSKLERFRDVSFGPYSAARQQGPQQHSWFFRRRSLPSLTSSAPANSLHQPLRSINSLRGRARNGGSQSPRKLNESHNSRATYPGRSERAKLPPLPKRPVGLPPKPRSKPPSVKKEEIKDKLPTLAVVGIPVAAVAGAAVLGATSVVNGERKEQDEDSGSMIDYGPEAEKPFEQNGFHPQEEEPLVENSQEGEAHEEEHVRDKREVLPEEEERVPTPISAHENEAEGGEHHAPSPVAFEISAEPVEAETTAEVENQETEEKNEVGEHEPVTFEIGAEEPEEDHVPQNHEVEPEVPEPIAFEVNADELKAEPENGAEPEEGQQEEAEEEVPEPVAFEVSAEELKAESKEPEEVPAEHVRSSDEVPAPVAFEVSTDELTDETVNENKEEEKTHDASSEVPEPVAFEVGADELKADQDHDEIQTHGAEDAQEEVQEAPEPVKDEQEEQPDEPGTPEPVAFEISADELKEEHVENQEAEPEVPEPVASGVNADELNEEHKEVEHEASPEADADGQSEPPMEQEEPLQEAPHLEAFEVTMDELNNNAEDHLDEEGERDGPPALSPEPIAFEARANAPEAEEHENQPAEQEAQPPHLVAYEAGADASENEVQDEDHDPERLATPPIHESAASEELQKEEEVNHPETSADVTEPVAFEVSAEELKAESETAEVAEPVAFEANSDELKTENEQDEPAVPEAVAFEIGAEELKAEPEEDEDGPAEPAEPVAEVPDSVAFEVSAEELKEDPEDHHEARTPSESAASPTSFLHEEEVAVEPPEEHQEPSPVTFEEPASPEVLAEEPEPVAEKEEHKPVTFELSNSPLEDPEDPVVENGHEEERPQSVEEEHVQKIVDDSLQAASESTPEPQDVKTPEPEEEVEQENTNEEVKSPVAFEVSAEELKEETITKTPDVPEFDDERPEEEGARSKTPGAEESSPKTLEAVTDEQENALGDTRSVTPKSDVTPANTPEDSPSKSPEAFEISAEELKEHPSADHAEGHLEESEKESVAFEVSADDLKEEHHEEPKENGHEESHHHEEKEHVYYEVSEHRASPEPSDPDAVSHDLHSEPDNIKYEEEHEVNSFDVPKNESQMALRDEPLLETSVDKRLLSPGEDHPTINLIEPSDCGDSNYQEDGSVRSIPITPVPPRHPSNGHDDVDHEQEQDITSIDNVSEFSEPSIHDRLISETPLKQPKNTPDNLSDDETEQMSTTLTDDDDSSVTMSSRQDSVTA